MFAAVAITPHQIYHQSQEVHEQLSQFADNIQVPWAELVAYAAPLVQMQDAVSGELLSAFGIYSTALFLLVSMRMTTALSFHAGHHLPMYIMNAA